MIDITQKKLKQLLEYNPETGMWRWKEPITGTKKPGWFKGTTSPKGYLYIKINGQSYLAHRLAWLYMYGVWPALTDHEKGERSDNRITELREVSGSVSNFNRRFSKDRGVFYVASNRIRPWRAHICYNKAVVSKAFSTKEKALRWRRKMEIALFGTAAPSK